MLEGIVAALSGLRASLLRQDVSANNVANVSSAGFARSRVNQVEGRRGGTEVGSLSRDFTPGAMELTDRPLDVALRGLTFIAVQGPRGRQQYTRAGNLSVDAEGYVSLPDGRRVAGDIRVPAGAEGVEVTSDGNVLARVGGATQVVGRLELARFGNPEGLMAVGSGLFEATAASGPAIAADGLGVTPGYLTGANTDLAEEAVQSIAALVGLRANAQTVRTQDDLLGTLLNVRR
jgi:flagellar basal-body rod protein FlgG